MPKKVYTQINRAKYFDLHSFKYVEANRLNYKIYLDDDLRCKWCIYIYSKKSSPIKRFREFLEHNDSHVKTLGLPMWLKVRSNVLADETTVNLIKRKCFLGINKYNDDKTVCFIIPRTELILIRPYSYIKTILKTEKCQVCVKNHRAIANSRVSKYDHFDRVEESEGLKLIFKSREDIPRKHLRKIEAKYNIRFVEENNASESSIENLNS